MERRRRISPSMVVASIALFVALAGTGIAAVLVTSSQIADETILSRDVKNGTLQSADIRDGSLLTTDIKNGTISKGDLSSSLQSLLAREVQFTDAAFTATLTNQYGGTQSTEMTVTTTRPGRLWITANFNGDIGCVSSTVAYYFLIVDGVPVRSSVRRYAVDNTVSAGAIDSDRQLTGITAARLPAGAHIVKLGIQCSGAAGSTGWAVDTGVKRQMVVVLE